MWKKILVSLITLLCVFFAGSAYHEFVLKAATAPAWKLAVKNGVANSSGSKFVLGRFKDTTLGIDKDVIFEAIKNPVQGGTLARVSGGLVRLGICVNSDNCPTDGYLNYEDTTMVYVNDYVKSTLNQTSKEILLRGPFTPTVAEYDDGGTFGLTTNDRIDTAVPTPANNKKFKWNGMNMIEHDWVAKYIWLKKDSYQLGNYLNTAALYLAYKDGKGNINSGEVRENYGNIYDGANSSSGPLSAFMIQPHIILDEDKIEYAIDADVVLDGLTAVSSSINTTLKLRVKDSTLNIHIDSKEVEVMQGGKLKIPYTTTSTGSNQHVTALFFKADGSIAYYQDLGSISASDTVSIDTSELAVNDVYQVYLANEIVTEDRQPTKAALSNQSYQVTITEPVSISYQNQYDASTITPNTYTYLNNVLAGQTIGVLSYNQGALPYTITLQADTSYPEHAQDYKNFKLGGLNSSNQTSGTTPTPLSLIIDSTGPDISSSSNSLQAGEYHFCISAKDVNQEPVTTTGTSLVCPTIIVTQADTSISFDTATVSKKSMQEAQTNWIEPLTYTPQNDEVKVTYSISGGDIGLIHINSDTGEISYQGGNAYGKVKIKAEIDDASSDKKNYIVSSTEKEIVIYRPVDGSFTPDAASSNPAIPTFTASDVNVKTGGVIGKIVGSLGTPDTIGAGNTKTTYSYGHDTSYENGSFFEVNQNTGEVKTKVNLSTGSYTIKVKVSDTWSTKEFDVTIDVGMAQAEDLKFYESSTSTRVITTKTAARTDTGIFLHARVLGSTNTNPVRYSIKDHSTSIITIEPTNGAVTIHGVGSVTVIAEKDGESGQANASAELTFTVTSGEQAFQFVDEDGNELPKVNQKYTAFTQTYEKDKTFSIRTAGYPNGAEISYRLKDESANVKDVISVDEQTGVVTILNASLSTQMGKIIIVATSHDPTENFEDASIELPINIEKGIRTISFADDPMYLASGSGSFTPILLIDGVIDTENDALLEVDASVDSSIAWTNDNQTIHYAYQEDTAIDIQLHATKPANRNYRIAQADGIAHILGADESVLAITSPGRITYGDHFVIRSTQDDSSSVNVQYTFEVADTAYISQPVVLGNKAEFDALKFSGATSIPITVTRSADGEIPLSKTVKVKVQPKEIRITIDDLQRLRGEENPPFTYQDFTGQLIAWNSIKDVIQPEDLHLSTSATQASTSGRYPISADTAFLNQAYPNYKFTIQEGTLEVVEELIADDWYHMELADENHTRYEEGWANHDIVILSDHDEYHSLSKDEITWQQDQLTISQEGIFEQSFWMKKSAEDGVGSGAITSERKVPLMIDKTAPRVLEVTASDTNNKLQNLIYELSQGIFFKPKTTLTVKTSDENIALANPKEVAGSDTLSYKLYKKEAGSYSAVHKEDTIAIREETADITMEETTGTYKICMMVTDFAGNTSKEACVEIELKKINVDVDGDGEPDFIDSDNDGCPDLNIVLGEDASGNKVKLNVAEKGKKYPYMNMDSNGDGKPDLNIDTDHDGRPDLNLVDLSKETFEGGLSAWKPTICVVEEKLKNYTEPTEYCTGTSEKAQINIDTNDDGIPDINIDTDGDMKADFNISRNGSTPFLNIGIVHKPWKPNQDYSYEGFTYDTSTECEPLYNIDTDGDLRPDINVDVNDDGSPDINIDIDKDGIPDVNIDSDGDGVPDINIDKNKDGIPDENIIKLEEWKPEKNVDGTIPYDTMEIKGVDILEDKGITVEKEDGTFLPNYAIKVKDVTEEAKEGLMEEAQELIGEQEVKKIYDVKLFKDELEIQPDGTLKVQIPMPKGITNPKVLLKKSNGTYEEIQGTIKDGYFIYETKEIGTVTILGDAASQEEPLPEPEPSDQNKKEPQTSVQGTYNKGTNPPAYSNAGIGGAYTGDSTSKYWVYLTCFSFLCVIAFLYYIIKRKWKKT